MIARRRLFHRPRQKGLSGQSATVALAGRVDADRPVVVHVQQGLHDAVGIGAGGQLAAIRRCYTVVWARPFVLYAPRDLSDGATAAEYVEAMTGSTINNLEAVESAIRSTPHAGYWGEAGGLHCPVEARGSRVQISQLLPDPGCEGLGGRDALGSRTGLRADPEETGQRGEGGAPQ